ncbi:unnamed protein product [Ilex paraguariensis]
MKGSCSFVASALVASTVALTSSSAHPDVSFNPCSNMGSSSSSGKGGATTCQVMSSDREKFAPRFDGLRFIETLVTAHR